MRFGKLKPRGMAFVPDYFLISVITNRDSVIRACTFLDRGPCTRVDEFALGARHAAPRHQRSQAKAGVHIALAFVTQSHPRNAITKSAAYRGDPHLKLCTSRPCCRGPRKHVYPAR
jgi:hypothetical protein